MTSQKDSGQSLREELLSNQAKKLRIRLAGSASAVLFGLLGFTSVFPKFQSSVASREWPSVTGVIERSEVESHPGRNSTVYGARIAYSYAVNGKQYSGNRVSLGDYVSSNPDHAQSIVLKYTTGAPMTVYYNPSDPSYAVLEVGVKKFTGFGLLACLIVFSIGLFGLWRNWMNWRKPAPP